MLCLVVSIAVESELRAAFTRLRRVSQDNGRIVEQILNLAVEDTRLNIDVLGTWSLHVRVELVVRP